MRPMVRPGEIPQPISTVNQSSSRTSVTVCASRTEQFNYSYQFLVDTLFMIQLILFCLHTYYL